jgi:hypothetical protein
MSRIRNGLARIWRILRRRAFSISIDHTQRACASRGATAPCMTALGLCLLALLLSLCPAAVAAETSEATSPNAELASAPKAAEGPKDSSPAPTNKTDDAIDSIVSIALYATGAILAALGLFFYLQRVRRARVLAPVKNKKHAKPFSL